MTQQLAYQPIARIIRKHLPNPDYKVFYTNPLESIAELAVQYYRDSKSCPKMSLEYFPHVNQCHFDRPI